MAFTNITEVGVRLGRPITDPEEIKQVNAWIADVESIIRTRIRDLPERVETGKIHLEDLTRVICNAVIRKIKNPDGKQNERIDDYSYGLTEDAARGELFLTEDEWSSLLGVASDGDAFTIRHVPEPGYADEVCDGW